MSNQQVSARELLIGALLGGLLAGVSVSLLTSKTGKKLRRDVEGKYRDVRNRLDDFVEDFSDKSQSLGKTFGDSACDWTEKVKDFVGGLKCEVGALADPEHEGLRTGFLIGGLVGGILAAGAAVAYSRNCESCDPSEFVEKLGSRLSSGKQILNNVLEAIKEHSEPVKERINAKVADEGSHTINEMLDFVTAGAQLWKRIKSK